MIKIADYLLGPLDEEADHMWLYHPETGGMSFQKGDSSWDKFISLLAKFMEEEF